MAIVHGEGLSFDDVLLVPQRGVLEKRADADISSPLVGDIRLRVPIVSAPMQSVTEWTMAEAMGILGGAGIVHRFMPIDQQAGQLEWFPKELPVGAAIGVNESYDRWDALHQIGCKIICLDIAHAHHNVVEDFLLNAPNHLRAESYLIAGNIATKQ